MDAECWPTFSKQDESLIVPAKNNIEAEYLGCGAQIFFNGPVSAANLQRQITFTDTDVYTDVYLH